MTKNDMPDKFKYLDTSALVTELKAANYNYSALIELLVERIEDLQACWDDECAAHDDTKKTLNARIDELEERLRWKAA